MLVLPIVVRGDRPGTDIRVLADGGVTEIGQVLGLGALADEGLLGLDEVADLGGVVKLGAIAEVRERSWSRR